jgi:TorA maturation chaperone TorD
LIEPPTTATLKALAALAADESQLGRALNGLADAARCGSEEEIADEFNRLFIGLTEGELRPYGSYYQVGFLYERPLADLRRDLARLGIRRTALVSEPEDHIALLCEVMAALIDGRCGEPATPQVQAEFFTARLGHWAPRFFADLEASENARFYRAVARLGAAFIAIEAEAFAVGETSHEDLSEPQPLAIAQR